jgi:phosphoribosylglycinamide formyltransferase-1
MDLTKKRIAVFASGNGTNAEEIFTYFNGHPQIEVAVLFSNKASAGVLDRAKNFGIPSLIFSRPDFYTSNIVLAQLLAHKVDLIVLAGFMWLVPQNLVESFPNKIVNIHPSLLPKFGGKGMYGMNVHLAVKAANEMTSGITIHFVNQQYDEGDIVAQFSCDLLREDTAVEIAEKVQMLEHLNYPKVIEELVYNQV